MLMHLSHLVMSVNISVSCKSGCYVHTQPFLLSHNCGIINIPKYCFDSPDKLRFSYCYLLLKNALLAHKLKDKAVLVVEHLCVCVCIYLCNMNQQMNTFQMFKFNAMQCNSIQFNSIKTLIWKVCICWLTLLNFITMHGTKSIKKTKGKKNIYMCVCVCVYIYIYIAFYDHVISL